MKAREGAIPGQYNVIRRDAYETVDRQVPIEDFIQQLREDTVPDEVCVVGLGKAFEEDRITELAGAMDERGDDLNNRRELPVIQFAVEGSFNRAGKSFDLRYGDELYPLQRVFGPQIDRQGERWLIAPF